jgi:WD40 repeat protein
MCHAGSVNGALVWGKNEAVLSWGDNSGLFLWESDGEVRNSFTGPDGHTGDVLCAMVWGEHEAILSWSSDGSLILWELDGSIRWRVSLERFITVVKRLEYMDGSPLIVAGDAVGRMHFLAVPN